MNFADGRHRVALAAATLVVLGGGCGDAPPATRDARPLAAASVGAFGERGPHDVSRLDLANPRWPDQRVHVFFPADVGGRAPIVVFAHANGHASPDSYSDLLDHMASRGHAVIYPSFMVEPDSHENRYDALWAGVRAGIDSLGDRGDTGRMGFVGHSYGGGAVPYLVRRAVLESGFGADGAFAYVMAPWYVLETSPDDLAGLPPHLKLLVEVFEDDDVNDHRIAIDLFERAGVPPDQKDFVLVRSDRRGVDVLRADHAVPNSSGYRARTDALDTRAVFRLYDALAAYAFDGDDSARRVALGQGSAEQVDMGVWPDGSARRPLLAGPDPAPSRGESAYIFRHADEAGWRNYGSAPE